MSLQSRITDFDRLEEDIRKTLGEDSDALFVVQRISPLILRLRVNTGDYLDSLRQCIALYISQCIDMQGGRYIPRLDEVSIIEYLDTFKGHIPCMTPNGMLVPKTGTALAYNLVVQKFVHLLDLLGVGPFVSSWHIPLNVRVKYGLADEENLKRHHPTEHIHSDSWAGESSASVTVHIPLFGDLERNHVRFYNPPDDFEEEWLGPRESYAAGAVVSDKYTLVTLPRLQPGGSVEDIPFVPRVGDIMIADFASLHESCHLPGAGTRVSIDTTFAMRRDAYGEVLHPWKLYERISHEEMLGIGTDTYFRFPDEEKDQVDSQGGFKHPTNLEVKDLTYQQTEEPKHLHITKKPERPKVEYYRENEQVKIPERPKVKYAKEGEEGSL
jgi:hypothetical protein